MDIPQELAFGLQIRHGIQPTPSRFNLQDPRTVQKYLRILEQFLNERNFLPRLEKLQRDMQAKCATIEIATFNELDRIHTEGILRANAKCRKLRMGQVPFSPRLVLLWQKLEAWQLVLKKCRGAKIDSKYLRRVLKAADIQDISLITEDEARANLQSVRNIYKQEKKNCSNYTRYLAGRSCNC
jgi:hypothetical protein